MFIIEMLREVSMMIKSFKPLWKILKPLLLPISRYLLKFRTIWVAEHWLWGFSLLAIIIRFWLSLIMIGQRNLFIL